jgi:signal transduction histidine kinase
MTARRTPVGDPTTLLRELALAIRSGPWDDAVRHLSRAAAAAFGVRQAATYVAGAPGRTRPVVAVHLDGHPAAEPARAATDASIGRLATLGLASERIESGSLARHPRYGGIAASARPRLRGLLTATLRDAAGRAIGRVALSDPVAGDFTDRDAALLDAFAAAASAALDRGGPVAGLAESQRQREALFGIVSHELRTPITTIYGGARMLKRAADRLDAVARAELVDDIAQEAERLHRLVENLLVLSRSERDALDVAREPILLQHLATRVVASEQRRWPQARLLAESHGGAPPVLGDAALLEQVLRNLVGNAVAYAGDAGPVTVRTDAIGGWVEVRVADAGPGVDEEDRERVFEPFYRAPGAPRKGPGAGIGLYVCRQLVAAMDGQTWLRPREPRGVEFGFRLPVLAAGPEEHPPWVADPTDG